MQGDDSEGEMHAETWRVGRRKGDALGEKREEGRRRAPMNRFEAESAVAGKGEGGGL